MSLWDYFSDDNEEAARDAKIAGINSGRRKAFGDLDTGRMDVTNAANTSLGYYTPYEAPDLAATNTYADALGLNGAEGNARATGAFQASPGYGFDVDQAVQSIMRTASARGQLGGGGVTADLAKTITGLANDQYGGWLDRLYGLNSQGATIAGQKAGITTGLGSQLLGIDTNKGLIDWNAENGIGGANAGYELSKNQSGANIFNAITGGLTAGAKLLGLPV
jgi:hypothetical protein